MQPDWYADDPPVLGVALDFGLFARLREACEEPERKSWSTLMLGAAVRGDREGQRAVEAMIYRRLAL